MIKTRNSTIRSQISYAPTHRLLAVQVVVRMQTTSRVEYVMQKLKGNSIAAYCIYTIYVLFSMLFHWIIILYNEEFAIFQISYYNKEEAWKLLKILNKDMEPTKQKQNKYIYKYI